MCGLVGIYSSNMLARHKDALSTLLYLDTFRGKDSTGVAAIRSNGDTHTIKSTVPGYEFIEGNRLDQHLRLNDFCWIGHNRFGTIGRNIKTNAHPFEVLDEDGACILVGAHNGTLKNKHVLTDHARYGTDSEALYNEIAGIGLEEALKKVEGAWALTYYDHIAEELRIIRNKERTLFYAYEEGKKTLIWASEAWMIQVAASRHGIKLENDKATVFNEDTLYSFPAPMKMNDEITLERKGGVVGKTSTFFQQGYPQGRWDNGRWIGGNAGTNRTSQPQATPQAQTQGRTPAAAGSAESQKQAVTSHTKVVQGIPGPVNPNLGTTSQTSSTPSGTQTSSTGGRPTLTSVGSSKGHTGETSKVLDFRPKSYKGYAGVELTKNQIEDQIAGGCGWCEKEHISLDDKFGWLAPYKPVCEKCLNGLHDEFGVTIADKGVQVC